MFLLWNLNMKTSMKLSVIGLLGLGVIASISPILRLKYLLGMNDSTSGATSWRISQPSSHGPLRRRTSECWSQTYQLVARFWRGYVLCCFHHTTSRRRSMDQLQLVQTDSIWSWIPDGTRRKSRLVLEPRRGYMGVKWRGTVMRLISLRHKGSQRRTIKGGASRGGEIHIKRDCGTKITMIGEMA